MSEVEGGGLGGGEGGGRGGGDGEVVAMEPAAMEVVVMVAAVDATITRI